jgi:DNA-binding protein HU-beta
VENALHSTVFFKRALTIADDFLQTRTTSLKYTTNHLPIMNKAELIDSVLKNMGKDTTKKAAGDAVEAVLDAIAGGIKKDKVVQLIGFGTFKVSQRAARKGRNPKTGETIKIKASKSVRFSPSSALKGKL